MTDNANSPREAFVVRLWYRSPEDAEWVAQVQHVRTGQVIYARNPEELLARLKDWMARDADRQAAGGLR